MPRLPGACPARLKPAHSWSPGPPNNVSQLQTRPSVRVGDVTDEQIAMALRQAEAETPVGEICRKLGVSEQSF